MILMGSRVLLYLLVATGAIGPWTAHTFATVQEVPVSSRDFAFEPGVVTVRAGASVTWTNEDGALHTASGTGGEFNTGRLARAQSATITFDQPGTFSYYCVLHANMGGLVIVDEAAAPATEPSLGPDALQSLSEAAQPPPETLLPWPRTFETLPEAGDPLDDLDPADYEGLTTLQTNRVQVPIRLVRWQEARIGRQADD